MTCGTSSPGVPGSLRIFPESPRRILCAAAPRQLSGPSLFSASPASEPRPCASLCALFFPPRAVPPTSHALVASFRLGPRLSCLPFPLAPRFPRRPPLCPMVLAAVSLSATGFASHAFFPPCAPFRRVLIPAASPLPARFLSLVLRLSRRAPSSVCRKSSAAAVRAGRSHARSRYLIKMNFFFN